MRNLFLIVVLIMIFSCGNSKISTGQSEKNKVPLQMTQSCPDDGICSLQVMQQSSLLIKTNDTGKYHPVIEKGKNLVIKYVYKRNPVENTADSNYSEILYFELPDKKLNLNLQDEDLRQVKLLYGRLCFCRGTSGYFPVNKGKLITGKAGKEHLKIFLDFSVEKIPQIIKQIDDTIDLN